MASLNWNISGVNRDQIAKEIATLRAQSPTFRNLEQMAWDRGYRRVEVTMAPREARPFTIADSNQNDKDGSLREMRISSNATGTFGIGGRQITVGEIIAHELAHGVIPPEVAEAKIDLIPIRGRNSGRADRPARSQPICGYPAPTTRISRSRLCRSIASRRARSTTSRATHRATAYSFSTAAAARTASAPPPTRRRSGSIDPGVNPVGDPGALAGLGSLPMLPLTRRRPGRQWTARMMLHRSSPIRPAALLRLRPLRATRSNQGRPIRSVFRSRKSSSR